MLFIYVYIMFIKHSLKFVFFMTAEPPFDRESLVTVYALYRLERGGVQVRREISTKNRDFQAVLRVKQPDANLAMIKWVNTAQKSNIKPTWKNLFLVLCLINLDHLAEQVKAYFSRATVEQLAEETSSNKEQDPWSEETTEEGNKEKEGKWAYYY